MRQPGKNGVIAHLIDCFPCTPRPLSHPSDYNCFSEDRYSSNRLFLRVFQEKYWFVMWQKCKVAFFNGKAVLCFASHQRGWNMEIPCFWKSSKVFFQLTDMIRLHLVALNLLPADCDSCFSGGGAAFIIQNGVCDALAGWNNYPMLIYRLVG